MSISALNQNVVANKKSKRVNFLASENLTIKMSRTAQELQINESDLIRHAIESFIQEIERKKMEERMIEACKIYNDLDKEIAQEWKSTETLI